MKAKAWLTVFCVISFLVIGGAGFFCFTASQAYSNARASWDDNVGTITSLGRKPRSGAHQEPGAAGELALERPATAWRASAARGGLASAT